MSSLPSARRLSQAHLASALFFFVNGVTFANLMPRMPEVKAAFGLSNAAYGFLVIAYPVGSILAGMAAAPALRRFGSGPVASWGSVAMALLVALAGIAGGKGGSTGMLVAFVAAMLVAGVGDAIVDTAQNAQAMDVQTAKGRSILQALHACWSLGAMSGGLLASAAIALHLPLGTHLLITGVFFGLVAVVAGRLALSRAEVSEVRAHAQPTPEEHEQAPVQAPSRGRATWLVTLILIVAIAGVMVEDLGQNWSALYLRQVFDAPAATAGFGLVGLMLAQFIGRMVGDRMIDGMGRAKVGMLGAALCVVGIVAVILAPVPAVVVVGFAIAGFGSATLVPSAYFAGANIPGWRSETGLTLISWLMRVSFLALPPVIGIISQHAGLRIAFTIVPVFGLMAIASIFALRNSAFRDGA